ncbi:unnamed protein product [Protopolystoma xenopodis]|uniref:Uncharacterized protein n=1 Tax=Protopolystoma xenopodis TaxID=117903 RepID=A0A448WAM6_9PLAT|nr:unnamed protein product [Protopolystoma xenopodis]
MGRSCFPDPGIRYLRAFTICTADTTATDVALDAATIYALVTTAMVVSKRTYMEETGRPIDKRLSEHRNAYKGLWIQKSEVTEHVVTSGHRIEWSKSQRFVGYGDFTTKCRIRDSNEINKEERV